MNSLESREYSNLKPNDDNDVERHPETDSNRNEPSIYDVPVETSIYDDIAKIDAVVLVEEKSIYDLVENPQSETNLNSTSSNDSDAKKNTTEAEVSIYEIHKTENDVHKTFSDKLEAYENFTYSSEEKKVMGKPS